MKCQSANLLEFTTVFLSPYSIPGGEERLFSRSFVYFTPHTPLQTFLKLN